MRLRALIALAVVACACAQYGAPPGGERDMRPPQVVETVPAPYSVATGHDGPVIIRFDERLSERGAEDAIVVSPQTGEVRVERDGNVLRVSVAGGWRPGQIYRIVILPQIADLFNNQRREAADLVFSTGPPIPATALAGTLTDRITGQPPERGVVQAVRRADSTVYVAPAGDDGFYTLLNLPNGTYDLVGFIDANQNWRRDPFEPQSRAAAVSLAGDTTAADVAILPFDTAAARVQSATQDGAVFRVQFDDYVEAGGLTSATARLYLLPDTTPVPVTLDVMAASEYEPPAPPALPDSLRLDSLAVAADTLAAARDTAALQAPEEPAVPLPERDVIIVPDVLPVPGEYIIEVQGVVNINGLTGGGGRAPLRIAPPAPPEPAPGASEAPPDTAAVPPRR